MQGAIGEWKGRARGKTGCTRDLVGVRCSKGSGVLLRLRYGGIRRMVMHAMFVERMLCVSKHTGGRWVQG